jgi:predicted transcriptional regulator
MSEDAKKIREAMDWSQADLARELGVAQSTICRIENGQPPSGPVQRLLESLLKHVELRSSVAA